MIQLVLLGLVLMFIGGGALFFHERWTSEGRAQCQAELKAADDALKAKADELAVETRNHLEDMATAYEVGESQAKTRTVYVKSKGASDVAKFPVFSNPACVLPADSLRNINAARAGFRGDPPADTVSAPVATPNAAPVMPPTERRPLGKRQ